MAKTYRAYDPNQSLLLPPNMREWLPEDHLALFVSDTVEMLDLSAIFEHYEREARGQPPYHPAMMVRVLVYGYCVGVRSSRRIWKALEDEVPFRVLGAGNFPDHRTISDFRKIHLKTFANLFVQVLQLARNSGLVKLGVVAIDGTKMKANASMSRNKNHEKLSAEEERLEEEVERILKQAEEIDAEEDRLYGPANRGDELPPGLRSRKERLARLKEAKRQLEEEVEQRQRAYDEHVEERARREEEEGQKLRGRKPKKPEETPGEDEKRNTTDPDSRVMKLGNGYAQAYNAQAGVDVTTGIIVEAYVTNEANDQHQLNTNLDEVRLNLDEYPQTALLDTGYCVEEELARAPAIVELLVATKKDRELREAPEQPAPRGRPPENVTLRERMERALRTLRGKRLYAKRRESIEPTFGHIKSGRGIDRFLLRGNEKADAEWKMICTGQNILKMWRPQRG